jgi:mono/diheme cytochrome c family protein/glucose/arabinose dehydrogenase
MRALASVSLLALVAGDLCAQRGDRPGEKQVMLPDSVDVPPAIVRTPAEERATFHLPKGYEVQLFASEPMVQDPVLATWDGDGRMWVCEFTSYMKDIVATDEAEPSGRIVVLHDDDGDGAADRSTVFAKDLVLPRAVLPMRGGALVITPPNLVWMPDADGDLVADGPQQVIMGGFEAGTGNPEHSGNGLTWGLDHRIHLCNDKRLLRWTGVGTFELERGNGGGQWGLAMDDRGRFYFNYNSDWLRVDLVPNHYGAPAADLGGLPGLNHRAVSDQSTWPARITPGVNRGYRKGVLRDYKLARTTGVCSPCAYRGTLLPCDGDVFVCEPCGNLVRRFVMRDGDARMGGDNAYAAVQDEFLTSTDERFRPVGLSNGPDGALYVVDMYRGVIQHRNYVTSFLRHQVEKRGLEDPIHKGRIWRIVPKVGREVAAAPKLSQAEPAAVAAALAHDSGTVRDQALQHLVQHDLQAALPTVRSLLTHERAAVRIAALSAVQGLGAWTDSEVRRFVRDPDAGVRCFAWQHAGSALARHDNHVWTAVEQLDAGTAANVRWHAALAVGDALRHDDLDPERAEPRALRRLSRFVLDDPGDAVLRGCVATAAHPHLGDVLAALAAADASNKELRAAIVDLSRRAMRSRDRDTQRHVLAVAGEVATDDARGALLQGFAAALPKGNRRVGWLDLGETPTELAALGTSADQRIRRHAQALLGAVRVGGAAAPGAVTSLTDAEKAMVQKGSVVFRGACAACHQLDGSGQQGLAPPLRDSEWVTGPSERLVRIALHGVRGPIEVDGTRWDLEMPGQGHLSDQELAQVLSYLRRAFGHQASCVSPKQVQQERRRTNKRASAWTAAELLGKK